MTILHITQRTSWLEAQRASSYEAPSLHHQGFIHFSIPAQVIAVANALYRGEADLVLLEVDPENLEAELRFEPPEGSTEPFPHLYGPLDLAAVIAVHDFPPQPGGTFVLPEGVREDND